jgi:hypothetical protein
LLGSVAAAPLAALLSLLATLGTSYAQELGWLEALSALARARDRAETCIRILVARGTPEQIERGRLAYSKAKADNEAVIAGLRTSFALDNHPVSLPSLNAKLQSSTVGLTQFCEMVSALVLPTPEGKYEKDVLATQLLPVGCSDRRMWDLAWTSECTTFASRKATCGPVG